MIKPWCASVECRRRIVDQSEALESVLDSKHDVIITSGGVSMGERDLVVGTAESLGWEPIFHKARIKPGKPIFFARRGRQLLFGLPGNPLSTAVTCALFVIPALKKMTGWPEYELVLTPARLGESSLRQTGRRLIWPGMARMTEDGLVVEYTNKKSSAALSALMHTDGLIIQSPVKSDTDEATIDFVGWNQLLNS
jgi:molybdopterin molybdotransferase